MPQSVADADEPSVKILLVDDHPANLLALEAILESLGQNLVRAVSGEDALRLLKADDFAAVLLDVNMPGLDGFAVGRLIRRRHRSRHTPIIFLTAYDSAAFPVAEAYKLGAVDYLVKPLIPDILRAKVAVFVELFQAARRLQRQAELLHRVRREQAEQRAWVQYTVAGLLAETGDLAGAYPRVLRAVGEGLGWDAAGLWSAEGAGLRLSCSAFWNGPGSELTAFEADSRHCVFAPGEGLPGRVWSAGAPAWIEDVAADPGFPRVRAADRAGLRVACAVPVRVGHETTGVLEFFGRQSRPRDDEVVRALVAVADQVGQSLERRRAEDALRRRERELADFVENATVGMHWVGADGIILWANRAELELLGYTHAEYVGRHIADFHADAPVINDILCRLTNNESLNNYEARLRCKDGSIKYVLINSNVYREGGKFVHSRCFTRDVTDRKLAEEAVKEAARRKDEWLAMLAHELRNPLAPLLTSLPALRRLDTDPAIREQAAERLERQVRHLSRLIEDLLDASRVAHGKMSLRPERLDLARLARTAAEDCRTQLEAAGVALTIVTPPTPVWVQADAIRLAQVAHNLLDNALKFCERNETVTVSVAADSATGQATLVVRDTVAGIAAEVLPRLFQPFVQGNQGLERRLGGLGLGLSVVKGLVELHGGTVEAASDGPGLGATFTVRLPLEAELPALAGGTGEIPAPGGTHRVLVIEDNRDAAHSLCQLLELLGHEVRVAYAGPEGVQKAAEWAPDVVLSDIGLPGFDGFEVARRLRRLPGLENALLVALTGYGSEEDRRRSQEAGFDHHLTKPADPDDILRLLAPRCA